MPMVNPMAMNPYAMSAMNPYAMAGMNPYAMNGMGVGGCGCNGMGMMGGGCGGCNAEPVSNIFGTLVAAAGTVLKYGMYFYSMYLMMQR